jgi:hypothetical protein
MMRRVYATDLRFLLIRINRETGSEFVLDHSNGGWALESESGAIRICGRGTPRDLYERMHAWLDGYTYAKDHP